MLSPPVVSYTMAFEQGRGTGSQALQDVLMELAKGWVAQGSWTEFVIWGIWWPAWIVGGIVAWSGLFMEEQKANGKL